jgi:hypothetical protein
MPEKIKVMLLATNQSELAYVRSGDELREIEGKSEVLRS